MSNQKLKTKSNEQVIQERMERALKIARNALQKAGISVYPDQGIVGTAVLASKIFDHLGYDD